jgi:hypothetical protein
MHEILGSCNNMVPLTRTSCLMTCFGLNGQADTATADGLLVVQAAGTLDKMTLQ